MFGIIKNTFILFILLSLSFSQKKIDFRTAEEQAKNPNIALKRSLIFPGVGQLYNDQKIKGYTLIAAELFSLYSFNENRKKYKDWDARHKAQQEIKKQFNKEKCAIINKNGYNKYFIINCKTMKVENTDLTAVNDSMKPGKIKSIFSKSMKGRIVSRTLLNKFIDEVA